MRSEGAGEVHIAWVLALLALVSEMSYRAGYQAGHRSGLREVTAELRAVLARHPR